LSASAVSPGAKRSQPRASIAYSANFASPAGLDREGAESVSGRPIETASVAAREKFRTDVTEMTVEARHRLKDLSTMYFGAFVLDGSDRASRDPAPAGTATEANSKTDASFPPAAIQGRVQK